MYNLVCLGNCFYVCCAGKMSAKWGRQIWDRLTRQKSDDRINKNHMTEYFWPYNRMNRKPDDRIYLHKVNFELHTKSLLPFKCTQPQHHMHPLTTYSPPMHPCTDPCTAQLALHTRPQSNPNCSELVLFCCIQSYLFGHLVFYLFSPLDSVYLTSSTKIAAKITLFICNNER